MNRKLLIALAVAIVAIAFIYMSFLPAATIKISQTDIEHAERNSEGLLTREITLSEGDTFNVKLYSHWSSGMKWSTGSSDIEVIRQEGAREFSNSGPSCSTGSPGTETWTFKATGEGQASISMSYHSVANLDPPPPIRNTLKIKTTVR
jgi:predicted secreted protein